MSRQTSKSVRASLLALAAAVLTVQSSAAIAQTAMTGAPQAPETSSNAMASNGAPPAQGTAPDQQAYAVQYQAWAQQNCVDQRTGNTAAGAIVGGTLGAIAGAALTHGRTSGTLAGGALGAVAGAEIGANSSTCPPGYVVRTGAPTFVYDGPYYPQAVIYETGPYAPWIWADGHWAYAPYGAWRPVYRYGRPHVVYHWR